MMKIVIAGNFPFPFGTALSTRVRNLALGLRDNDAIVHVISIAPAWLPKGASSSREVLSHDGVTFELVAGRASPGRSGHENVDPSGWQMRHRSLAEKARWFTRAYTAGLTGRTRLRRHLDESQTDAIVVHGEGLTRLLPLVLGARQRPVVTILDIVENDEAPRTAGGPLSPIYWDLREGYSRLPSLVDGVIVITSELERRLASKARRPSLLMPAIEEWANPPAPMPRLAGETFRLMYVGALISRDAPQLMLDAMRRLHQHAVPVSLDVVGRFEEFAEGRHVAQLCREDPALMACVNLIGRVTDAELIQRTRDADGLILLRRDALTEWCSFPTRLPEYLKSGRPVFASSVGDVPRYLRDGVDAVLLHPSDAARMADSIAAVVSSPDRGASLGAQGRRRGSECFNRTQHAARLLGYIAEIQQSKAAPGTGATFVPGR